MKATFKDTQIVEGCNITIRKMYSPELLIQKIPIMSIHGLSLLNDPIGERAEEWRRVNAVAPLLLKGNHVT